MERGPQGEWVLRHVSREPCRCFVPRPLPPDPPIVFDSRMHSLLEQATLALGRLDALSLLLPDASLLLYLYVRKEAVLSSQIEGTQSSLSDLLLYESSEVPGVPLDDVREVCDYVAAMQQGLAWVREGIPLSVELLLGVHGILLAKGRGSQKQPGELRVTHNWVGGTRPGNALFVPPPPEEVLPCLRSLEGFLAERPGGAPALVKAALAHVQFETIHPFLDGNGRLGRLLVTLILCADGILREPLLYLSLYLKQNRRVYYDLLQRVRFEGDWEAWLLFFLEGVRQMAEQATETARRVLVVFDQDRQRIEGLGRASGSALRLHQALRRKPLLSIAAAAGELGLTPPTAASALSHLQELGIVREISGRARGRVFAYDEYVRILNEGTEPLP